MDGKDLKALIDLFDTSEALEPFQPMWENEEDDWIQNLGFQWIVPLESYIEAATLGTTLNETL